MEHEAESFILSCGLTMSVIQVRSILDAQALQTLQESSAISAELAGLAREDSIKATKDARRLNIITILGFLYLPASFVAVSSPLHGNWLRLTICRLYSELNTYRSMRTMTAKYRFPLLQKC